MSENKNGYTGVRYLLDMADTTQYAVVFENGQPKRPLYAFNNGKGQVDARPNATLLAFDADDTPTDNRVAVQIYRLTTNELGQLAQVKIVPADYCATSFNRMTKQHHKTGALLAKAALLDVVAMHSQRLQKTR